MGHLYWGISLAASGSFKGALGQFKQAIQCNPQLAIAYYEGGMVAFELGMQTESIDLFEKAVAIDQHFSEAYNALGTVLCISSNLNRGIECFKRAIDIDPQYPLAHRNWAQALFQLNQLDESIRHYSAIMELPPSRVGAMERSLVLNDWGVTLFRQNKMDDALDKFFESVDINPEFDLARANLGMTHMILQEFESACEVFEKGISVNFNVTIAHFLAVNNLILANSIAP